MSKLNVRKRGNKWEYRFEVAKINGKRKQVSKCGFALKKDAIKAGTEAMNLYNKRGIVFETSKMSFADYLDYWLNHYVKSNCNYSTLTRYKNDIEKHIKPNFGAYPLYALKTKIIQEFLYKKKDENYSKSTVKIIFAVISSALNYAVNPLEYIEYNPCNAVKFPKFPSKSKEKEIITPDMFNNIIELTGKKTDSSIDIFTLYTQKC